MSNNISLAGLVDAFFKEGEQCIFGCSEDELDLVWGKVIKKASYHKNVYAAKNWIWYDIHDGDDKLSVVKADYIMRTDNRRFNVGDWVRTSPIKNFAKNCICETSSSYYILVGEGSRKDSDSSIFSFFG